MWTCCPVLITPFKPPRLMSEINQAECLTIRWMAKGNNQMNWHLETFQADFRIAPSVRNLRTNSKPKWDMNRVLRKENSIFLPPLKTIHTKNLQTIWWEAINPIPRDYKNCSISWSKIRVDWKFCVGIITATRGVQGITRVRSIRHIFDKFSRQLFYFISLFAFSTNMKIPFL